MPRGRPTAFKPEYVEEAQKLCKLGATDVELADFFKVSIVTIWSWQRRYPEFLKALKMGKDEADERVVRSLYHKAIGYTFDSEKVFQFQGAVVRTATREHVAPDTTAGIFWLKNRRPAEWREKTEPLSLAGPNGEGISSIEVHFVKPDPKLIEHEPMNGKANGHGKD